MASKPKAEETEAPTGSSSEGIHPDYYKSVEDDAKAEAERLEGIQQDRETAPKGVDAPTGNVEPVEPETQPADE